MTRSGLGPGRIWRGARRRAAALSHRVVPIHGGIPWAEIERRRAALRMRRTFGADDLNALARLIASARALMLLRDAAQASPEARAGTIAVRHDMDHDLENSVRYAAWEGSRGIRSTYFVLHTDWYWGDDPDRPSRFLATALRRIAAHGHEIGVHNNAITAALRFGGDPADHLARAVNALRREGFEISGTVAHGDDICHEAGFENGEMFLECTNIGLGAPDRVIRWEDRATGRIAEVALRPVPMADFGLAYEANYLWPRLYLSDTGGRWNYPFEAMVERFAKGDAFLQVLVHPVWWAFQGEAVTPKESIRTGADITIGGRRLTHVSGTAR